jgi:hypothetical protein
MDAEGLEGRGAVELAAVDWEVAFAEELWQSAISLCISSGKNRRISSADFPGWCGYLRDMSEIGRGCGVGEAAVVR